MEDVLRIFSSDAGSIVRSTPEAIQDAKPGFYQGNLNDASGVTWQS